MFCTCLQNVHITDTFKLSGLFCCYCFYWVFFLFFIIIIIIINFTAVDDFCYCYTNIILVCVQSWVGMLVLLLVFVVNCCRLVLLLVLFGKGFGVCACVFARVRVWVVCFFCVGFF